MTKYLFSLALSLTAYTAAAQTDPAAPQPPQVYNYVEKMPTYPPGINEYLSANIKYPAEALKNNVEGRVLARFVVTATGDVDKVTIMKGIGSGCDEEVVRVLNNMGKWIPGRQNGKAVDVYFTLPVGFHIPPDKPAENEKK